MTGDVGSLQEELARLAAAVTSRIERPEPPHSGHPGDWSVPATEGERPAACEVCPVCQLIALARGQRSETVDKVVRSAALALAALTEHLNESPQAKPEPAAEPESGHVQRIDIGG